MFNRSTARLLIEHIKRLIEDDMKFTVEAFKLIENEIDTDLSSTASKKNFSEKKITRRQSTYKNQSKYSREMNIDQRRSHSLYTRPSNFSIPNNTKRRISSQDNFDHPLNTTPFSKFDDSRNALHTNRSQDRQFESYSEFSDREHYTLSDANSTKQPKPFTSSSKLNVEGIPCFNRSEVTMSDPYRSNGHNNSYQPYSDANSSKFNTVEDLYPNFQVEFKKVMSRILERFNEYSKEKNKAIDKADVESITDRIYDELSYSLSYGNLL